MTREVGPERADIRDEGQAAKRRASSATPDRGAPVHATAPLDPIYAWGIVLEPVEILIERTSRFIDQLARETRKRGESFSDEELEERFLAFFERLVDEGTLRRLPDAPPEMGRQILGPRRWLRAQRIRIERLVQLESGEGEAGRTTWSDPERRR